VVKLKPSTIAGKLNARNWHGVTCMCEYRVGGEMRTPRSCVAEDVNLDDPVEWLRMVDSMYTTFEDRQ
jgi:hypothetical protein